jgi:rod shape-determining protein MreD
LSSSRSKPHVAPFVGPPWYVAAAWLALALVAQTTLVHYLTVRGVVPSLVLLVVIWYAIRADVRRATLYGLAAGLAEDAVAMQTGAAWTISTAATAALASVMSRGFFADSIPLVTVTTVIVTLMRALLFWVVMALTGYPSGLAVLHFHEALWQALLNVVVMIAAMLVARRFEPAAR